MTTRHQDTLFVTDDNRLVTERVAAEILTLSVATLRRMRARGEGPAYVRISQRRIAYPLRTLYVLKSSHDLPNLDSGKK